MNPLYQQFQTQQQANNPLAMLFQLKQNPYAVLSQRFNIPQNITNPNDILQYLLNTNQVSQQQLNSVMQRANDPTFRRYLGG